MTTQAEAKPRIPLSRERVLAAAVELADEEGIEALSMRRLGQALGVQAMSLYNHVANKDEILDGVVDTVMGELEDELGGFDVPAGDWKPNLRARILAARRVMLRHKWAPGVIETRTTISPLMMRYFDGLLGIMIEGGFTYDLGHHAMHAFGSRALGFDQELFEPDDDVAQTESEVEAMMEQMADQLPYATAMLMEISHDDPEDETLGWCDDQTEFEFALDLVLDGLERRRTA